MATLVLFLYSAVELWAAEWHGNYFPNVELIDQDGRTHKFYDDLLKGKIVTINFVYTNCKDICPADTAQLSQVQRLLGDRVGRDFHMYSITIDPDHDTPEVLRNYVHTFGLKPGWLFLTGRKDDIKLIQEKLAMRVFEPGTPRDHDTSVMVANEATGQWSKRSVYDDPVVLANLLTDRMTNFTTSIAGSKQDYSVATQLPNMSRGEYLFRTRCVSCHTVGGGSRLGPDLLGVATARPREWLSRWIREPDKMIEAGDPVALALKARFKNIPMPNFGLGEQEAEALIDYLLFEDRKAASTHKTARP